MNNQASQCVGYLLFDVLVWIREWKKDLGVVQSVKVMYTEKGRKFGKAGSSHNLFKQFLIFGWNSQQSEYLGTVGKEVMQVAQDISTALYNEFADKIKT